MQKVLLHSYLGSRILLSYFLPSTVSIKIMKKKIEPAKSGKCHPKDITVWTAGPSVFSLVWKEVEVSWKQHIQDQILEFIQTAFFLLYTSKRSHKNLGWRKTQMERHVLPAHSCPTLSTSWRMLPPPAPALSSQPDRDRSGGVPPGTSSVLTNPKDRD